MDCPKEKTGGLPQKTPIASKKASATSKMICKWCELASFAYRRSKGNLRRFQARLSGYQRDACGSCDTIRHNPWCYYSEVRGSWCRSQASPVDTCARAGTGRRSPPATHSPYLTLTFPDNSQTFAPWWEIAGGQIRCRQTAR